MIWLVIIVVAVLLLAYAMGRRSSPPTEEMDYRVALSLYRIRRRREVAEFKSEVRRDAVRLRRELRDELNSPTCRR